MLLIALININYLDIGLVFEVSHACNTIQYN